MVVYGNIDCKTVSFFSRFSVVLSLRYQCVTWECVMYESREATQGDIVSLQSHTYIFMLVPDPL